MPAQQPSWPRAWLEQGGVALAYVAAALCGKLIATPPNNIMLLWPAAAVGVVAVARAGPRLLPGIAVGGFAYSIWRFQVDGALGSAEFGGAALNGAVVALRAWLSVAAYDVLRRRLRPRREVMRIALLLVTAGPLASLVAATLGSLGLWAAGHITLLQLGGAARSWFVSDTLGVWFAGPVLLMATSRTRLAAAATVGVAALGLLGWYTLSSMELRATRADFARAAREAEHLLEVGGPPRSPARIAETLAIVDPEGLHIRVVSAASNEPLYTRPAQGRTMHHLERATQRAELHHEVTLRDVRLEVAASNAYAARHRSLLPLAALMLMWLVAALSGQHLRVLHRRSEELQVRVRARTRALERAMRKAEAASEAKSAFLAHMSHELRTPMNGVIGLTELIMQDELTSPQKERARMLKTSARSLMSLIDDVLDLARIEQGRVTLDEEAIELCKLAADVKDTLQGAADTSDTTLRVRCSPDLPSHVRADGKRLLQIVLNLAGNAVKFSPGGEVELRMTRRLGGGVRLEVEDDGVGISAEAQARIFQPFEQSDGSTTRRFGGTGLGLAITHQLVQLMEGEIGVHSRLHVGSTFWVELPLAAAAPPSRPAATVTPDSSRPLRVLLAEDNPVNQYVARALLEREGCTVEVAPDGLRALERWQDGGFDIIFMDCQMPNMDGYETSRRIRADERGPRVPIVALTASALDAERERCFAAGMDDFLSKPVDSAALGRAIARWSTPPHP